MMSFFLLFRGLILLSWCAMVHKTIANQNILNINCSYQIFTPNSTYHVNLNKLLNLLASKTENNSLFSNLITGPDAESNNTVYSQYSCRGDYSINECNICVANATRVLSSRCPTSISAHIWYEDCKLYYSNVKFFEAYNNESLGRVLRSDNNVSVRETTLISAARETSTLPPLFSTSNTSTSNLLGKISLKAVIAIVAPVSILLGLATFGIGLFAWKLKHKNYLKFPTSDDTFDAIESLQYSLEELKAATQNFSDDNKIGKGGFGCVYKGILQDGQEIAVKKLFKSTSQVEAEFKNEVKVQAKVQHNNLVRLLGFCMSEGENLLVFEYVPNPSLDKLLFDEEAQVKLDWETRFKIITGIARGLFYLHEESRHSIVHRDLKPANILLDGQMNPKIADFGMARFFGIRQDLGNTNNERKTMSSSIIDPTHQITRRGGGTPGYMAPECSPRGRFSIKTDVYSYGVMILEIISGKRNTSFYIPGLAEDLLSYSWIQWKAGNPLALIDEDLASESAFLSEEMREQVLMCIHIGLLCIQKDPHVRPTMRMIVNVYSNYQVEFKKWARGICEGRSINLIYV